MEVSAAPDPDPPLKGRRRGKRGSSEKKTSTTASTDTDTVTVSRQLQQQTTGVRSVLWRVCSVEKKSASRRLLVLQGYARAEANADGKPGALQRVRCRAMVDTGAQGCFVSPSLVRRMGATPSRGNFGVALEAFGGSTALTHKVTDMQLQLDGRNPRSTLAQTFEAQWDCIVAPAELSDEYDLLLGQDFLRHFGLSLSYCSRTGQALLRLTAHDGTETQFGEQPQQEQRTSEPISTQEQGTSNVARVAVQQDPCAKPISGSQRRELHREWREMGEARATLAERAATEVPQLVMSLEQLEQLWKEAKAGSVKVHTLWSTGFHEQQHQHQQPSAMKVNRLAFGKEASGAHQNGTLLPPEERKAAEAMVARLTQKEFPHVFPDKLPPLPKNSAPPTDAFEIKLREGTQPFGRYGPRMTAADTAEAEKMLRELLELGFIRPSRSPWGSPMFLVEKPDGSKRMVIDYRALNASTVRNRYPLPRTDELFDQLAGARYFSKIDLRTGYWQIRVAADSVAATAFTSRHGHFEWLVLPMGLTNAPAEFMHMMEDTFREQLNKSVLVFLDDILVYSRTLEEHEQHLRQALQRLSDRKLYGKLSKCQFARQEVEFLGHYVGRRGVSMVEGKVAAVERWPTPTKQKDVEQFLGLAGYYRRFIANFSKLAAPLSQLCGTLSKQKSGVQVRKPPQKAWKWGPEQDAAFAALKKAVVSAPCLAMPDPQREFIVHTDASGYATGAVLMQRFDEGLRPIAFLSRSMKPAERNYPVHEQELLAILNALTAWRHYLSGRPFIVLTDHQSLQYVESSAMATPRQVRWAARLADFDFRIKYAPGSTNVAADALSRGAAGGGSTDSTSAEQPRLLISAVRQLVNAVEEHAPLPVRVREATQRDEAYLELLDQSSAQLAARQLDKAGGLLYRQDGDHNSGQLVVPNDHALRTWLLASAHDALQGAAHAGAARTSQWLKQRVWWAGMDDEVERYVRGCEACQRNKPDTRGRQGLPLSLDVPPRPWHTITMDFIGPLPKTAEGYDAVMVVVDKLTRYSLYVSMRTTDDAQTVWTLLNTHVLAHYGAPSVIVCDSHSRFTSHFWESIWACMSTALKRSTAFRPQTDGQTERQNRTLVEALRAFVDELQGNWATLLPQLQFAHNTSISASTGFTPFEMQYGRQPRALLDAELEADGVAVRGVYPGARELARRVLAAEAAARERIKKAQAKQRADSSKGRRPVEIAEGDKVWLSNRHMRVAAQGQARKLRELFWGPYTVLRMHGSNAAELELPAGCRLKPIFNTELLRKYIDGKLEFPGRPQLHARPGPVPEEDEEQGGPAAGQPDYAVQAVIGRRTSRGKRQYWIVWEGWPREQAQWVDEEHCHCADKIEEFEQQRRQLNAAQVQLAAVRAHIAVRRQDAVQMVGPQTRQEAARQQAVAAEADTKPLADGARLPPATSDGQIVMGTQQCVATTKDGGQCRQKTRHGAHCWVHLAQLFGARIKQSTVANAGKGLFAARDFRRGEVVARYTGELVTMVDFNARKPFTSPYVLELSETGDGTVIDAARTNSAEGRMVNDARGSGKRVNVRFSINQVNKTATLRAKHSIRKGDEFFVSYGKNYWATDAQKKQIMDKWEAEYAAPAQRKQVQLAAQETAAAPRSYAQALGSKQAPIVVNRIAVCARQYSSATWR